MFVFFFSYEQKYEDMAVEDKDRYQKEVQEQHLKAQQTRDKLIMQIPVLAYVIYVLSLFLLSFVLILRCYYSLLTMPYLILHYFFFIDTAVHKGLLTLSKLTLMHSLPCYHNSSHLLQRVLYQQKYV